MVSGWDEDCVCVESECELPDLDHEGGWDRATVAGEHRRTGYGAAVESGREDDLFHGLQESGLRGGLSGDDGGGGRAGTGAALRALERPGLRPGWAGQRLPLQGLKINSVLSVWLASDRYQAKFDLPHFGLESLKISASPPHGKSNLLSRKFQRNKVIPHGTRNSEVV